MNEEDKQQHRWNIYQLLCRYCELVDQLDWEAMHEVFTADTVGIYNEVEIPGLQTLIENGRSNMTRDLLKSTQHNVSNLRITLEENQASCVSNYYAVHLGAGPFEGEIYSMWGAYDDQLIHTGSGWRIARRDYQTFFTQGDPRMVFGGEQPIWD